MKTTLLFAISAMVVMSCSKNDIQSPPPTSSNLKTDSYRLEVEEIEDRIGVFIENMGSRTQNSEIQDVAVILRSDIEPATKGAADDTVMYAVNFEDEGGFILLSTDKRVPVLAMVDNENFYGQTDNEGLQMFLELSLDYIEKAIHDYELRIDSLSAGSSAERSIMRPQTRTKIQEYIKWITDGTKPGPKPYPDATFKGKAVIGWGPSYSDGVKPVLKTAWNQSPSPYNSLFPLCEGSASDRHAAGCTNVAIAQIMSHFEIPKMIPDPRNPRVNKTLNWAQMKATPHAPDLSTYAKEYVSYLLRGVSIVFNSETGCNGTATNASIIKDKMWSAWKYTMDPLQAYNVTKVKNSINASRPVFIRGARYADAGGGHAWVLDGYKHYIAYDEKFEVWSTGYTESGEVWVSTSLKATKTVDYLYCNWGYGPYYSRNGYYLSGVWDMGYRPTEANPTRGDYHFRYNVETINNIKY